ncbi:hypothetical protein PR048_010176 [Dryococelus australis]|uniref:Uncharacterized protein n=1 Tax=Dryococelus australis TaxID=614101 RepID=A0ABQ9I234_9NEOP|nr:hypothetical protein PR048_010176 [Dryococelus australis]
MNKNILLGKIHDVQDIPRRHHGLYDDPSTSRRQVTISNVVRDGNGKNVRNEFKNKFTENDRNLIRARITSFPQHESHYSHKKSTGEFVSADLNMNRLFREFKQKHPDPQDFPKLKFAHPVVDSRNECDRLNAIITCSTTETKKAEASTNSEQHHMKAEEDKKST